MFSVLILLFTQADTVHNLRDFRLPEVGATQLYLGASMWLDRYDLDREGAGTDTDSSGVSISAWRNYGYVSWKLRLLGEARFVDVDLFSSLGGGITLSYYDSQAATTDSSYTIRQLLYRTVLNGSFDVGYYIKQFPWFLGGTGWVDVNEYTTDNFFRLFRRPHIEGGAFFQGGFGKVRDVTPVIHSWYFLEEAGNVSGENISSLAEILARRWSYQVKYWRHQKFFYPDVENELIEDNVTDGLSIYEAMRLREIVENFPRDRLLGGRVSLGAGISTFEGGLYPAVRLALLAGAPVTRRWQLSGSGKATVFLPTHTTISGYLPEHEVTADLEIYYYIGERWQLRSLAETRLKSEEFLWSRGSYSVSYTPIGVVIYLDNHLDLNLYATGTMATRLSDSKEETSYLFSLVASLTWRPY